jgi:cytochrome d ubiquinol oxidase subunit II
VAFSGYLAAVYLAADSVRGMHPGLTRIFRTRALAAGAASGALALAGLLVMRHSGLDLTRGPALALVCVSAVAGLATMALCWLSRFELARVSAALAVAAVVAGWAAAQAPRMLPGMTVSQAAAGRGTLVALVIAVSCGAVVLVPSLALLYTLFLRGRLDALHGPGAAADPPSPAVMPDAGASPRQERPPAPPGPRLPRAPAVAAIAGLIAGTGLVVLADMAWAHALGVACLVLCAVAAFRLATGQDE